MEYRLNRYISSSGYCSRREADQYIQDGKVTINSKRASLGARVLPKQKVRINGHLIEQDIEPVYIAFNKPVGIVSTTDDSERHNIVDYISHEQRIFPIGRLDKDSQGLILMTNDGDIVNKILRAGNENKKEYIVTVDRPITEQFLHDMANGVPILDRVTRKCELEQINPTTFKIGLTQGLNRQIRRMCEHFLYNVVKLERIQVMNIKLGTMGVGNWRDLTESELEVLFDLLETAENTVEKTKRKSPSTLRHEAQRKSKRNSKFTRKSKSEKEDKNAGLTLVTKKDRQEKKKEKAKKAEDIGKPKNSRQAKEASGARVGKHRPDKLARRIRGNEHDYKRRGGKKKEDNKKKDEE